jgi:hypothetical protein
MYKIESEKVYIITDEGLFGTQRKLCLKEKSKVIDWKKGYNYNFKDSNNKDKINYDYYDLINLLFLLF